MPNKFDDNEELEPLPIDIRAAFHAYPRPKASAEFDSNFWRELDARQTRYRGVVGVCRRLLEIELEGVAVWRLGLSTLGGGGTCVVVVALVGALSSPRALAPSPSPIPTVPQVPTSSPRYARELLNETFRSVRPPASKATRPHRRSLQGGVSCLSLNRGWA